MMLRSRTREHLVSMLKEVFPMGGQGLYPIVENVGTDYPFRIFLTKTQFGNLLLDFVDDVTYGNFKDEVHKFNPEDVAYHHACLKTWHTMRELE